MKKRYLSLFSEERKKLKGLEKETVDKGVSFLEEVESRGIIIDEFDLQTEEKGELLIKYFKKFRSGEKQDISDYYPVKLGALFKNVHDGYKRK